MNKQKIASITKGILGLSGSAGTGFIIGNIVAATTPPGSKVLARLCINIASAGISGMVATQLNAFTDAVVDQAFNVAVVVDENSVVVVKENAGDADADTTEKDSE